MPDTFDRPPSQHLMPLIASQHEFSYPKEVEQAKRVRYFPLADILTRAWTSDAHMTAYSVPELPYRLSRDAIQVRSGVLMVLFIGDIDCQQSHAASSGDGDAPAPDEWWWSELVKLDALRQAFPGAFVYRTKGGYRILYLLATPRVLTSAEAVEGWRAEYLAWIAALRLRFQIYADPSCHDWQRLYRVPHATRVPGGRPEARETLGSPYQIGSWFCESTDEERALARTLAKKPSTRKPRVRRKTGETSIGDRNGVLFRVFKAREWLGDAIETGKWRARCPWEDQHTKGDPYNTSTVLFAPGSGEIWGWLHCSHGHCAHRDIRDVLKIFSEDELTRAKREAGVVTPAAQQKPLHRLYRPHFGVWVKGVRRAS